MTLGGSSGRSSGGRTVTSQTWRRAGGGSGRGQLSSAGLGVRQCPEVAGGSPVPRVGVQGVKTWRLSRCLGTELPPTPPTSRALGADHHACPSCRGRLGLSAAGAGEWPGGDNGGQGGGRGFPSDCNWRGLGSVSPCTPRPGPVAWPVGCSQRLWDQGGALPGNPLIAGVGSWPPAGGDGPGPQAVLTVRGHGPAALSGLTWLLGLKVVPMPQSLQRGVLLGAGRRAPGGVTRCMRPSTVACLCPSEHSGALCLERAWWVWWAVPGAAQT